MRVHSHFGYITDNQSEYAQKVVKKLKENGFRAKSDLRNEKIGFKIREHTLRRVPYLLVVGDKEIEAGEIAVRSRKGDDLGKMSVDAFIELACEQIKNKQIQ